MADNKYFTEIEFEDLSDIYDDIEAGVGAPAAEVSGDDVHAGAAVPSKQKVTETALPSAESFSGRPSRRVNGSRSSGRALNTGRVRAAVSEDRTPVRIPAPSTETADKAAPSTETADKAALTANTSDKAFASPFAAAGDTAAAADASIRDMAVPSETDGTEKEEAAGKKATAGTASGNDVQNAGGDDKTPKENGQKKEKKARRKVPLKKMLLSALCVAAVGAAAAYGYGVYYYSGHFLPGTAADGTVIENLTVEEADELLTESHLEDDRKFTLTAMDGEKVTFDTLPLSIERHYKGLPEALEEQNKWAFFLKRNEPKVLDLDYSVTYDRAGIDKALESLDICDPEKTEPPVDSYVYRDEQTGEFLVKAPVDGNTVDKAVLSDALSNAVEGHGKELDLKAAGAYKTAQIRENDETLIGKADTENKIEAIDISVVIGEGITEKMTPDEFRKMISKDPETCTLDSIIDSEGFNRYVDKIARSYTTKSASGYRYFKSFTGERHAMQTDYGWDLDEAALASQLLPVVAEVAYSIYVDEIVHYSNPEHTVEAAWTQTAESHGERDTGDSWVEVDLTSQHVYCVIDGELKVETDCVTGLASNAGRRTPEGFYKVSYKTTERDLVGYRPDGTESYRSHVHYWMPFNKNIGLHDATWRGRFGGTIYKNDGSHGCVNLPLGKAKEIYGYVYKGMPVIVYK